MQRAISGYHRDEAGEWVAELSCGHGQHIRHRPPFQLREWVLETESRASRLGTPLNCPLCDRAELPDGLALVRSSQEWDEHTIPAGLLRAHRIAAGTWGRINVRHGQLRFVAQTEPALDRVLGPGSIQAIPPEVRHQVQPIGAVCFSIDFLSACGSDQREATAAEEPSDTDGGVRARGEMEEGGEPACWAHLLCPECGTVLDGAAHVQGCQSTAGS